MSPKQDSQTAKRNGEEATKVISEVDVPPVASVGKHKIRSVDLEPRSNGENDWQDERPARKDGDVGRS